MKTKIIEKLQVIIERCAELNIPVHISKNSSGKICYEVDGFSKSGIATLYIKDEKIICETRYNTLDEIDNFDDLSLVAFEWYVNYMTRSPFEIPSNYWAEYWVQKGYMKKEITTSYKIL